MDLRALRNDRVTLTERGAPHSLALMESGKLLPGVNVIIANADTKGQCGDSHLGEVCLIRDVLTRYFKQVLHNTRYSILTKLMIILFRSGYNVRTTRVDIIQYMEMIQVIKITLEHD